MTVSRAAYLQTLRAQRAAIDQAIRALEALQEFERQTEGATDDLQLVPDPYPSVQTTTTTTRRPGIIAQAYGGIQTGGLRPTAAEAATLRLMKLGDAIKWILRRTARPLTNQEIAQVLIAAEFPSESSNMPNNVGTAIWRMINENKDNSIERVGNTWKLVGEQE